MDEKVTIYTPEDCYDIMIDSLRKGKVKGTSTYNDVIDNCWKWRKKEANIWTGYANEGKSIFLKQLFLIKALKEDWKAIFCSPEDFPPEEFFDDLIHTFTGITTDRDFPNVVTEELYNKAFQLIKDKFIFLYLEPPNNTIKSVLAEMRKICKDTKVDVCVIDPLLKFARPKDFSDRDDIYASYIGSICTDFCRTENVSFHLVMHQLTPTFDNISKKYQEPSMYRIKGGGSWSDGFDNVLSVWRPNYAVDKMDATVQFSSQKIKKQKLVGIPQKMECSFDRKTNRYIDKQINESLFDFDKFIYERKPIKRF